MQELTLRIIAILQKYMRDPAARVGSYTTFSKLGIDRLDLPMIFLDVEDVFDVQIDYQDESEGFAPIGGVSPRGVGGEGFAASPAEVRPAPKADVDRCNVSAPARDPEGVESLFFSNRILVCQSEVQLPIVAVARSGPRPKSVAAWCRKERSASKRPCSAARPHPARVFCRLLIRSSNAAKLASVEMSLFPNLSSAIRRTCRSAPAASSGSPSVPIGAERRR
jgi:acyl carrier protein